MFQLLTSKSRQRTADQEVMEGLCVASVLVFSELDQLFRYVTGIVTSE